MSIAYRLAALVVTLAVLVLGGWYIGHLRARAYTAEEAAVTAQAALKKAQATLVYREKLRAATGRETASAQASLSAAAASNPTWADASVPKEVQDALCAHLDCGARPDGLRGSAPNDSP